MPTLPPNPSAASGATREGPLEQVPVMLFRALAANERDAFLGKPLEKESFLASMRALTDPGDRGGALPRRKRVVP